jgi:hypothetical protein
MERWAMEEKVTLEGRVEALGSGGPGYGNHRLVSIEEREDNSNYVLTSDVISLDGVEGQNVRVSGTPVAGYPTDEGGPVLLNVTEVSDAETEKGGEGRPDRGNPAD